MLFTWNGREKPPFSRGFQLLPPPRLAAHMMQGVVQMAQADRDFDEAALVFFPHLAKSPCGRRQ